MSRLCTSKDTALIQISPSSAAEFTRPTASLQHEEDQVTPHMPTSPPSHRCRDAAAAFQQCLDARGVRAALTFSPVPHNGAAPTPSPARQGRGTAVPCMQGFGELPANTPKRGPSRGQLAAFSASWRKRRFLPPILPCLHKLYLLPSSKVSPRPTLQRAGGEGPAEHAVPIPTQHPTPPGDWL